MTDTAPARQRRLMGVAREDSTRTRVTSGRGRSDIDCEREGREVARTTRGGSTRAGGTCRDAARSCARVRSARTPGTPVPTPRSRPPPGTRFKGPRAKIALVRPRERIHMRGRVHAPERCHPSRGGASQERSRSGEASHERQYGYTHNDAASEHPGDARRGCAFGVGSGLMYRPCRGHTQNEQLSRPHRLRQGLDRRPEPRCAARGA